MPVHSQCRGQSITAIDIDRTILSQVYAEQVNLIYTNAPFALKVTVVNLLLITVTIWKFVSISTLLAWLACNLLICFLRYLLVYKYLHIQHKDIKDRHWDNYFTIGTFSAGLAIGSSGIFLFPTNSLVHQIFLVFVLGGMVTGAAGTNSVIMKVFLSYSIPAMTPMIIRFLLNIGNVQFTMGLMLLIFLVGMSVIANRINRTTITSLINKFKNKELIAYLMESKEATENLNVKLTSEINERKQMEVELQKARKAADAASRAKSEFMANMSHELRTPLNAILGYVQLLRRHNNLTEIQKRAFSTIEKSGNHLLDLINDILDMSSIEAGKMKIHHVPLRLPELLSGLSEMIRIQAEQKGITFHYETASNLPKAVYGDEKRLRQVLLNLLNNAIKFTEQGEVTLHVGISHEQADPQATVLIRFQVQDTGIGIEREQLKVIFSPFKQVGKQDDRMVEGTGLGLAISRTLVTLMGGVLHVNSIPGKGSTFWFDIFLPEVAERSEASEGKAQNNIISLEGTKCKLLIVDDIDENRALLKGAFLPLGFEIEEANDGKEAMARAREFHPDLILIDLIMPVMNGFEATRNIRQIPDLKDVVIIAVSADAFYETRQKSLEAGCNDFITKPINVKKLLELVQFHLGLKWPHMKPPLAQTEQAIVEQPLIAPPKEELEVLLKFVKMRNVTGIREHIEKMRALNPHYLPFISRINQLSKKYQFTYIIDFIKPHLRGKE